jgi:hypothetical protein
MNKGLVVGTVMRSGGAIENMAKKERITMNGVKEWGLNVSETVGIGGANKTDDVMLIEARFRDLKKRDQLLHMYEKKPGELSNITNRD